MPKLFRDEKDFKHGMIALGVVVLAFVILSIADAQTKEVMTIGECISKQAEADGFPGELKEAWQIYYDSCKN